MQKKPHITYLSLLRAVHTPNLDVPMLGTWDDLKPFKVTSQDHNITARGIGLSYKPRRYGYVIQTVFVQHYKLQLQKYT